MATRSVRGGHAGEPLMSGQRSVASRSARFIGTSSTPDSWAGIRYRPTSSPCRVLMTSNSDHPAEVCSRDPTYWQTRSMQSASTLLADLKKQQAPMRPEKDGASTSRRRDGRRIGPARSRDRPHHPARPLPTMRTSHGRNCAPVTARGSQPASQPASQVALRYMHHPIAMIVT